MIGGGYVIPARMEYLCMLESLQKEYKGAVGMAMLNYCTSRDVSCQFSSLIVPHSSRTRTPLPDTAAPDNCRHPAPTGHRRVPVQHHYRRRLGGRQSHAATRLPDSTPASVYTHPASAAPYRFFRLLGILGAIRRYGAYLALAGI